MRMKPNANLTKWKGIEKELLLDQKRTKASN
jgi:hypothetical protein